MNENNTTLTVENLRKSGNRVKVHHYRRVATLVSPTKIIHTDVPQHICFNPLFGMKFKVSPKGGRTEIFVLTPNGAEVKGISHCSKSDPFNRKEGVRIALERVQEELLRQKESLKNVK